MDKKTIEAYDTQAKTFASKHASQSPTRLYSLAQTFFIKGAPTADIGCGAGRDTCWLNSNEYPTVGFDPSEGMLTEAKNSYPKLQFKHAHLPFKDSMEDQYENIFCCAVLMHVPHEQMLSTIISLLRALKVNGNLILSWRHGQGENDGRQFFPYFSGQVAQLFESIGGKVKLMEEDGIWNNLVIEKADSSKRPGIQQIQDIISRDKKTATYKLALIRALCEISRYESHSVTWYRDGDMVLVPLKRIAVRWMYYYMPLVKSGIKQTTSKQMAFENGIKELDYKVADMALLKRDLESSELRKDLNKILKKVAETIKKGPVAFAGGGDKPVFGYMDELDASLYPQLKDADMGMIAVPLNIWRDINYFAHWIENSLAVQWAEMTEKIDKSHKLGHYLDLITKSIQEDERTTYLVRKMLDKKGLPIECIWSGKKIESYAVDHMIPWSLWKNNDLWNLLPSSVKANSQKSDFLPNPRMVRARFDVIRRYWEVYNEVYPSLFESQLKRGLGVNSLEAFTSAGLEAMERVIVKVNMIQGGKYWSTQS